MKESYKQYQTLILNGHKLEGGDIIEYCRGHSEKFLHDIGNFVKEWISPEPFVQVHTSGSTGKAKTMQVRKDDMLYSAFLTADYFAFEKEQTALLSLPAQYIAGKMMIVRAFFSRLNLLCVPPSNASLSSFPFTGKIDFAPLVPMQLKALSDPSVFRKILLGGAPVSHSLTEDVMDWPVEIFHGYGMTETLSHVAIRRVNKGEGTNVYSAMRGIQFTTDDRDCLIIDLPWSAKRIFTNDIVKLLNTRSFVWRGRYDYVVNSGGVKLIPDELEAKIQKHISFRFFLAELPDQVLGEKLCLFIEAQPFNLFELRLKLDETLSRFEKPREIFFITAFSETPNGKVNRKQTVADFLRAN